MSIQAQIDRLYTAKENIKTAIQNQGVAVSVNNLDNYASYINSIASERYYTGSTTPDNSVGNDGDLFLVVT